MNVNILLFSLLAGMTNFCFGRMSGHNRVEQVSFSQPAYVDNISSSNSFDESFFTISYPKTNDLLPAQIIGQNSAKDSCQMFFDKVTKNHLQTKIAPKFHSLLINGPAGCSKTMLCQAFANVNNCILIKVDVPLTLLTGVKNTKPELLKTGVGAFETVIKNLQWLEMCSENLWKKKQLPVVIVLDNMHLLLSCKGAMINSPAWEAIGTGISLPVRDAIITAFETWKNSGTKFGLIGLFSDVSGNDTVMPELANKFDYISTTSVLDKEETKQLLESLLKQEPLESDFDLLKAVEQCEKFSPKTICAIASQVAKIAEINNCKISNESFPSITKGLTSSEQTELKLPSGFKFIESNQKKTLETIVLGSSLKKELQELLSVINYTFSDEGKSANSIINQGFTAIVGESGSGKTSIIEALANSAEAKLLEIDLFTATGGPNINDVITKLKQSQPDCKFIVALTNAEMILSLPSGYLIFDNTIKALADAKLKDVLVFIETCSFNGFETKLFKPNLISKIIEVQLPSRDEIFNLILDFQKELQIDFQKDLDVKKFSRQCIGLTRSQILSMMIKARHNAISQESEDVSLINLTVGKSQVLNELNLLKDYVIADASRNPHGSYTQHCKHKGNFIIPGNEPTTFKDVAGQIEAKEALMDIIEFLKDPEDFTKYGNRAPKGILFYGPPGTGKTLLARAMAGEALVPMIFINGASFVEMYVGVGASRIRDLFKVARRFSPCIIFIDEIDAVATARSNKSLSCGESEATLNQLLSEMDGFSRDTGIIVIGATNKLNMLDRAIRRPGRMDREIEIENPGRNARIEIMSINTKSDKIALGKDVSFEKLAELTTGCSGADVENIIIMAINMARKENIAKGLTTEKLTISQKHLEKAVDLKFMGEEKRESMSNKELLKNIAIHESGHAILQTMLPHPLPFHKVTIVGRRGSLGHSRFLAKEDHYAQYGLDGIKDQIAVCMGSRAAEFIMLGKRFPGVSGDLEAARSMATDIVCSYGGDDETQDSFGPTYLNVDGLAEVTKAKRDLSIEKILKDQYERALKILSKNKVYLEKVADKLQKEEELSLAQMQELLTGMEI